MESCKSTAEEVSFEWSHHRILLRDPEVKTLSIIDSESERVLKYNNLKYKKFLGYNEYSYTSHTRFFSGLDPLDIPVLLHTFLKIHSLLTPSSLTPSSP